MGAPPGPGVLTFRVEVATLSVESAHSVPSESRSVGREPRSVGRECSLCTERVALCRYSTRASTARGVLCRYSARASTSRATLCRAWGRLLGTESRRALPAAPGPRTLRRTPRLDAGQHGREATARAPRGPASTAARVLAGIRPHATPRAATLSPGSHGTSHRAERCGTPLSGAWARRSLCTSRLHPDPVHPSAFAGRPRPLMLPDFHGGSPLVRRLLGQLRQASRSARRLSRCRNRQAQKSLAARFPLHDPGVSLRRVSCPCRRRTRSTKAHTTGASIATRDRCLDTRRAATASSPSDTSECRGGAGPRHPKAAFRSAPPDCEVPWDPGESVAARGVACGRMPVRTRAAVDAGPRRGTSSCLAAVLPGVQARRPPEGAWARLRRSRCLRRQ
jgi:hypothetical protein